MVRHVLQFIIDLGSSDSKQLWKAIKHNLDKVEKNSSGNLWAFGESGRGRDLNVR